MTSLGFAASDARVVRVVITVGLLREKTAAERIARSKSFVFVFKEVNCINPVDILLFYSFNTVHHTYIKAYKYDEIQYLRNLLQK